MPIFEYRCKDCDNTHEQILGLVKVPLPCPFCQSNQLEKLISVPAKAQFKGEGFFVNDYPKPKKRDENE